MWGVMMKAGRELDALVAENVFDATGWCPDDLDDCMCRCDRTPPHTIHLRDPLPEFSTDIAAAEQVINRVITGTPYECYITHQLDGWDCWFTHPGVDTKQAHGDTISLAVCLAALEYGDVS